jgi:hypothetical protein
MSVDAGEVGVIGTMDDRKPPDPREKEEDIFRAFERERSKVQDLSRMHEETVRNSRERDRQVLIERRRHPR